jgi:hypothetical protein
MACEAEIDAYKAALIIIFGTALASMAAPGWWKIGAVATFIGACLNFRAAARRLADCMRSNGLHFQADILEEHMERLTAEVDYLHSLGVPATA